MNKEIEEVIKEFDELWKHKTHKEYGEESQWNDFNVNDIRKFIKQALEKVQESAREENIKCKKCWDKGYSTEHKGSSYIRGKKIKSPHIIVNICKCERGKSIEELIKSIEQEFKQEYETKLWRALEHEKKSAREEFREKILELVIYSSFEMTCDGRPIDRTCSVEDAMKDLENDIKKL